jgi:hypothetical protein
MKTQILAGAAAVALVAAVVAIPASPAFASGTGTIVVQAETPTGAALHVSGLYIEGFDSPTAAVHYDAQPQTNSQGVVAFLNVPSNTNMTIELDLQKPYLKKVKTDVKVSSGQSLSLGIKATKGASVSGTVTILSGAADLNDGKVALLNSSGGVVASSTTDSNGTYTIDPVPSGSYRVQFNSRSNNFDSAAALSYAWGYWNGATKATTQNWSSANTITVKQQGSHAASVTTGINGNAASGAPVNSAITYWSTPSSRAGHEVTFIGSHPADSFTTVLGSNGQIGTNVVPGKYRIGIYGDFDDVVGTAPIYWYTSETAGPTEVESQATWVTIDYPGIELHFNKVTIIS